MTPEDWEKARAIRLQVFIHEQHERVGLFILAALIEKKGFYEKCGYSCIDDEIFVDEGAKQCWMTKAAYPVVESSSE
ncbi:hypothetical protein PR001_g16488 [Phytophthora rubi]|uniref:Glucosamine 6-phosphate N-acetyltransferase n=1 Tax=Phytophthora rubi TaxID=129364 RepID=A0A6A3L0A4_9STRA|nr:hypothetical protein PR001_g16488 [Phytophthora rubi]